MKKLLSVLLAVAMLLTASSVMSLSASAATEDICLYQPLLADGATSGSGANYSWSYADGVLTIESTASYGCNLDIWDAVSSFNVATQKGIVFNYVSEVPVFMCVGVTTKSGSGYPSTGTDFYESFGYNASDLIKKFVNGEQNLFMPAGSKSAVINLNGYFTYNNNAPADGNSAIGLLNLKLGGKGKIQIYALHLTETEPTALGDAKEGGASGYLATVSETPEDPEDPTDPTDPAEQELDQSFNLVPADANWASIEAQGSQATVKADGDKVLFGNTADSWPAAALTYEQPIVVDPQKSEIEFDFTANGATAIVLFFGSSTPEVYTDDDWMRLNKFIDTDMADPDAGDISGTFKGTLKLAELPLPKNAKDEDGNVVISGIKVFAIGAAADNIVEFNKLAVNVYKDVVPTEETTTTAAAEETTTTTKSTAKNDSPKTGDADVVMLVVAVMMAAVVAITATMRAKSTEK